MLSNKQSLLTESLALSAQATTVVTFEDSSPNDLTNLYGGLSGWTSMPTLVAAVHVERRHHNRKY